MIVAPEVGWRIPWASGLQRGVEAVVVVAVEGATEDSVGYGPAEIRGEKRARASRGIRAETIMKNEGSV